MKFLITGVSGFVGEELVNFLQKDPNHSILGIDRSKESSSKQLAFRKMRFDFKKTNLIVFLLSLN